MKVGGGGAQTSVNGERLGTELEVGLCTLEVGLCTLEVGLISAPQSSTLL